ncbi:hypothetical protein BDZ88DRAFT_420345 [Geranomyces variabilis]|nr:hypothetical protein BDZ88DRAFT_420345 [Geranomyces variabilis]
MHLMSSDETIRTLVDVKAIDVASEMGDLDLLNTLIEMGTPDDIDMMYTKRAVDLALERNDSHDILRWWLKNGLRIDCTWSMAQILSGNGAYFYFFPNTRVLELVKAKEEQSPGSLDWTTWLCSAMDTASVHGQVDALEWLKNSGWPITWTDKSMDATRSVNVLAWWVQSGLELKYTENLLNSASANGHIDILEFWRTKSGFFPLYTERAMDTADNAAVLAWWKKAAEESSWELRYTDRAVGNASDCFYSEGDKYLVSPSLPILRWWAASGLPLKLPNNLSPDLVRNREVKQWWTLRRRWLDANDSP